MTHLKTTESHSLSLFSRKLIFSVSICFLIALCSCQEKEAFQNAESIVLLDPVINPVVLLNAGVDTMSRRKTLSSKARVTRFNQVPVINLNVWGKQLQHELRLYAAPSTRIRSIAHNFSSEKLISDAVLKSYQKQYKNSLIVSLYIELNIDNRQSVFIDDDVLFSSQEYAYHWSQRVSDANPASLIATIYINYLEPNTTRSRTFTLEVQETSQDIIVDSSDLNEIDATTSPWFERLRLAIIDRTK